MKKYQKAILLGLPILVGAFFIIKELRKGKKVKSNQPVQPPENIPSKENPDPTPPSPTNPCNFPIKTNSKQYCKVVEDIQFYLNNVYSRQKFKDTYNKYGYGSEVRDRMDEFPGEDGLNLIGCSWTCDRYPLKIDGYLGKNTSAAFLDAVQGFSFGDNTQITKDDFDKLVMLYDLSYYLDNAPPPSGSVIRTF